MSGSSTTLETGADGRTARTAIVLVAHGTVESLDELPAFLANIRHGQAPSPELLAEVRRRYEAIGGRSPLLDICRVLAEKVEARTQITTRVAMRLWHPYPRQVLEELATIGKTRIVVVPLAQHSAAIYGDAVKAAARAITLEGGPSFDVRCASNWGQHPGLTQAFALEIQRALDEVPSALRSKTSVVMTAHSLPVAVVQAGDPYEAEVRKSAAAVAEALDQALGGGAPRWAVHFQSQGMSAGPRGRPVEWLGPDLRVAIEQSKDRGDAHVLVAPLGFLADHVEVLYDLDIEAAGWAKDKRIGFSRTRSLNASDALVDVLVDVARPLVDARVDLRNDGTSSRAPGS